MKMIEADRVPGSRSRLVKGFGRTPKNKKGSSKKFPDITSKSMKVLKRLGKNLKFTSMLAKKRTRAKKNVKNFFSFNQFSMREYMIEIYKCNLEVHAELVKEYFRVLSILIDKSYPKYLKELEALENTCHRGTMWPLTVQFYKTFLVSLFELGEYKRIIAIAKRFRSNARAKEDYRSMMFSQEMLAKGFSKQKKYKEALICYLKVLKIALKLKDYKMELKIYDMIGITYFHMNDVQKAQYFHQRMIKAELEPSNSNLRQLQIRKSGHKYALKKLRAKRGEEEEPLDSESEEEDPELFYAPKKEKEIMQNNEILKAGYENNYLSTGGPNTRENGVIGTLNFHTDNERTRQLYIAHYYKRIVKMPKSALTHLSTNRVIENYDSNCSLNQTKDFRFKKYFCKISSKKHGKIHSSMMQLKKTLDRAKEYLEDLHEIAFNEKEGDGHLPKIYQRLKSQASLRQLGANEGDSPDQKLRRFDKRRKGGLGFIGIYGDD